MNRIEVTEGNSRIDLEGLRLVCSASLSVVYASLMPLSGELLIMGYLHLM